MANIHNNTSVEETDGIIAFWYKKDNFIMHVVTRIIICISLPLTLMTIYALYSLVRKDHVAPIYVINLLISDLIQLCCMIVLETTPDLDIYKTAFYIYYCGLVINVCFMVCVSLERYLLIAHPLWYHFKRTIKNSVVVSVVVWLIPPVYFLTVFPWVTFNVTEKVFAALLVIPFPFFIFFLVGTLRALSACVAVPSEEKRRIVGILVLVLLIYTLLFLPYIIRILVRDRRSENHLIYLFDVFPLLSLLADLILYIYIRKEAVGELLTPVCCCKKSSDANINTIDVDNI